MLEPIELTQKFIRMDTINPPGHEKILADYISSLFSSTPVEIFEHIFDEGRSGLILTLKGEKQDKPPIAFTGHLDTVPLGNIPWAHPPLEGLIEEGKLIGRGSSDMKSGLAAFLAAIYNHVDILRKGYGAIAIITACEELACQGAKKMAKDGILPPSIGPLIIAEPTGGKIHKGHKGVFWVKANFTGIAAHGSMPHEGHNAIEDAIAFYAQLKQKISHMPPHPDFGAISLNLGSISGGSGINLVADSCELKLDMRLTPHINTVDMENIVKDLLKDFNAEYEILDAGDCVYTTQDNAELKLFAQSAAKMGADSQIYAPLTFFTDGSPLLKAMNNTAAFIYGPGEAEQCHKVNEFAYTKKITQAYEVYSQFIKDYQA